jgi:hypothetical protein
LNRRGKDRSAAAVGDDDGRSERGEVWWS